MTDTCESPAEPAQSGATCPLIAGADDIYAGLDLTDQGVARNREGLAGTFRKMCRYPAFSVVTAAVWASYLAMHLVQPFSRGLAMRARFAIRIFWSRMMLRILGVRVEVRGKPPEAPFLLVSNHLSYIDIPVLMSQLRCNFLAKAEISRWPVLGAVVRTTGTLFVDRSRKSDLKRVLPLVQGAHEQGWGIVIFPEGTSTRGLAVERFKPSLFQVAVDGGEAVSTASLSYSTPPGSVPADLSVCWWGDMPFAPHLSELLTLPSISAVLTFGDETIVADDRKEMAELAHRAVASSYQPCAPDRC